MRKKTRFLIYPLLIVGVFLVFVSSCEKDDDNGSNIPVLSTSAVTDINEDTAISGGNITSDGGATVTARGVCWSTEQIPTISDNKTTDGTGAGTFVSNISGLEPNTTYYVRAYATNGAGTGYGSAMLFTTTLEVVLPVLSTTEVTEITQTTATVKGNITDDGGATVTARGVCWSTNQNPTISNNKTTDGTGAGTFVSNISGLEPNTTYYVRAYATNSAGTGYGSTMSFTTEDDKFTDSRDGNVYKTVTIGNQVWMAENLKYLPSVNNLSEDSQDTPGYYVSDYDGTDVTAAKATANYTTYGVLYNWPAAMNACPTGWHLPSDAEWTELTDYLGGEGVAGGKLKEIGTTHWNTPNTNATNETGFTALPGGGRNYGGSFNDVGSYGGWWSATEGNANGAWYRDLICSYSNVYRNYANKELGLSVRCLRD